MDDRKQWNGPIDSDGMDGLDELARTDRFIDALADGRPAEGGDSGDRALAALLESWRDELRVPQGRPVSDRAAVVALRDGSARRRRSQRVLTAVGSAAAAVLAIGGFGAAVIGSHPGDPLYNLRSAFFGEPVATDDEIVLTAKTELDRVQQMIAQEQWDQAQERLTSLGDTVQAVSDSERRQDLVDQWNQLSVQVEKRDPNAVPQTNVPSVTSTMLPAPDAPDQVGQ